MADPRNELIGEALTRIYSGEGAHPSDKGMVTGWITCVEIIGDDGQYWVRLAEDPHTPVWRLIGLLEVLLSQLHDRMAQNWQPVDPED